MNTVLPPFEMKPKDGGLAALLAAAASLGIDTELELELMETERELRARNRAAKKSK